MSDICLRFAYDRGHCPHRAFPRPGTRRHVNCYVPGREALIMCYPCGEPHSPEVQPAASIATLPSRAFPAISLQNGEKGSIHTKQCSNPFTERR